LYGRNGNAYKSFVAKSAVKGKLENPGRRGRVILK
jgi:hypothetical protein